MADSSKGFVQIDTEMRIEAVGCLTNYNFTNSLLIINQYGNYMSEIKFKFDP